MIETEEESSDLDSSLKIEYGIRSYVVSDGGAVSRTSPEMRDDLERASDNISGFTQRRCEVSDESRERILTLSHSPSVIKPSQAMGVCRGSRAFKLPMSPMCSRAASDSVRQECGGYHCEAAAGP